MKHVYYAICLSCQRQFTSKYPHAKTCSNACRMKLHRTKKKNGGTSLHDLSDDDRNKLQQILMISERSYNVIFSLLLVHGSYAASSAIDATYSAALAVLEVEESKRS